MRHRSALFTAVILLFLGVVQVARGEDKDIDRLVKQLGSGKFKEREAASSALGKVGKPALTALRKAAKDSDPAPPRLGTTLHAWCVMAPSRATASNP